MHCEVIDSWFLYLHIESVDSWFFRVHGEDTDFWFIHMHSEESAQIINAYIRINSVTSIIISKLYVRLYSFILFPTMI